MALPARATASRRFELHFFEGFPTMLHRYARGLLLALLLAAGSVTAQAPAPVAATPFKVVDGYKVDAFTMSGFRTWRAGACDRCHGANQEGLVGPSLVNSLKSLTKDEFVKTVRDGRQEKGMVSFAANATVMSNIDALYVYLKGRSDGTITRARVEPIEAAGAGS